MLYDKIENRLRVSPEIKGSEYFNKVFLENKPATVYFCDDQVEEVNHMEDTTW